MSKRRQLVKLVLDFDGTLTMKDTLHIIAQAGYDRQQASATSMTAWKSIVDAYAADYESHKARYNQRKHNGRTIQAEVAWLNSLRPIEVASAKRVFEAGIFDHLTMKDMHNAARCALQTGELQLRSGWVGLINHIYRHSQMNSAKSFNNTWLNIISVNWSRSFIRSVLQLAMESIETSQRPQVSEIAIYANEVPSIVHEVREQGEAIPLARGEVTDLRVSEDKLRAMNLTMSQGNIPGIEYLTVYVGDSPTDLQCLLHADVGICVRDEPLSSSQKDLVETCERLGLPCEHISECLISKEGPNTSGNDASQSIWWCRDFDEVTKWLKSVMD